MNRAIIVPVIIMVSAMAVLITVTADVGTLLRAPIAFWFLLACPGMAFIGLLNISDHWTEWILAIGLSLTLDTLTVMVMLYIGVWSLMGGVMVLIGQSMLGSVLQIVIARRAGSRSVR